MSDATTQQSAGELNQCYAQWSIQGSNFFDGLVSNTTEKSLWLSIQFRVTLQADGTAHSWFTRCDILKDSSLSIFFWFCFVLLLFPYPPDLFPTTASQRRKACSQDCLVWDHCEALIRDCKKKFLNLFQAAGLFYLIIFFFFLNLKGVLASTHSHHWPAACLLDWQIWHICKCSLCKKHTYPLDEYSLRDTHGYTQSESPLTQTPLSVMALHTRTHSIAASNSHINTHTHTHTHTHSFLSPVFFQ